MRSQDTWNPVFAGVVQQSARVAAPAGSRVAIKIGRAGKTLGLYELGILRMACHPNILHLVGVFNTSQRRVGDTWVRKLGACRDEYINSALPVRSLFPAAAY